ncbi:MAG: PD40 domain-containing protein [Gammaproteobacteria bacterium]|nr:PD40 domain-containing protein [Gammaproteobacteria bacterium]
MNGASALLFLLAVQQPATATPPLPETDILLYEMSVHPGGVALGLGRNITAIPGYDNQPSFSADGRSLFFSARRDGKQNDIYRFDLRSHATERLTQSPKNEYSPAEGADKKSFTVVWEDSGQRQEIWRYPAKGGRAETVLKLPDLIGYYTFAAPEIVFAFILGEPQRLERIELSTLERKVIAVDIGRCVKTAPDGSVSYVRMDNKQPILHRIDGDGANDTALFPLLPDTEGDYAWLPDGSGVLSTRNSALYYRGIGAGDWQLVAEIKEAGGLSRLAVSPDGKLLALVAAPR